MQRLLTTDELADRLHIGVKIARQWLRTGRLPVGRKLGKRWLLHEGQLDEYMRSRPAFEGKERSCCGN